MQHHSGRQAMRIIGAAIREHREQRALTLEQLAAIAGISYQYLSGIETGKENFSISILERVVRALDVSMPALILSAYRDGAPALAMRADKAA